MNPDTTTHYVIGVSSYTALVLYEQDQAPQQIVINLPRGEEYPIYYRDVDALPEGNRQLRSRVKKALQLFKIQTLDREKQETYKDMQQPVDDPKRQSAKIPSR